MGMNDMLLCCCCCVDLVLMVGCFLFPQTLVGYRLKLAEGYEVWTLDVWTERTDWVFRWWSHK